VTATSYVLPARAGQQDYREDSRIRRISVCHIASGDAWAGAEAQIATLARELARRPDVVLSAIVLNPGRLSDELKQAGIEVAVIAERKYSFLQVLAKASQIIRESKPQILHSHRYKENLIATLLGRGDPSLHLVRTQHGRPEKLAGSEGIKQWLVHAVDRVTARYSADQVVSVSSQLAAYLETHVGPEKISVIHNGIDLERVHSTLTQAEAKRKFRLSGPVVGFVGRLEQVKRLDLFIETARRLGGQLPGVTFVIAGSGRKERSLRQLVASCELQSRIILLGHCSESAELLRALDLLLITSDHEGLPMVVLEAMAAGTPVVARAVGGIPEIVTHEETGWLVEPDAGAISDLCTRVLHDECLRERIAARARTLVEARFSATVNADRMLDLYRCLCRVNHVPATATSR